MIVNILAGSLLLLCLVAVVWAAQAHISFKKMEKSLNAQSTPTTLQTSESGTDHLRNKSNESIKSGRLSVIGTSHDESLTLKNA